MGLLLLRTNQSGKEKVMEILEESITPITFDEYPGVLNGC